ncbi:hypothetical protein FT666_15090 [Providencia rettgeri]|nr:hypothetical protein CEQ08_10665 [Providencia rettgeri]MBQ0536066.1 hypothetical protein [Providencia huaxiensis]EKH6499080.1 hypothetical protein [Providencia rettgeri]ELR5055238.1 hypothetical protein [Providencia rettgeri]ELR5157804.1 hypothetical protein [Providencia rettgeri]
MRTKVMQESLVNYGSTSLSDIQLECIKYDQAILSLSLSKPTEKITLSFEWIYSLRVTDEGDLLKMLDYFNGKMTTGVYKVENSSYLEWFHEQSENIHDEVIEHYLIVTIDEVIEVLASVEPSIEIIN